MEKANTDWAQLESMQGALNTLRDDLAKVGYNLYYSIGVTSYGGDVRIYLNVTEGGAFGPDVISEGVNDVLGEGETRYTELFTQCEALLGVSPLEREKKRLLARIKEIEEKQANGE